jgi:hypothetical protein
MTTPAIGRERHPESEDEQPQARQVDAERTDHLAVVRTRLDHRAVGRLFQEQPQSTIIRIANPLANSR